MDDISASITTLQLIAKAEECELIARELLRKAMKYRADANKLASNVPIENCEDDKNNNQGD